MPGPSAGKVAHIMTADAVMAELSAFVGRARANPDAELG